jgi:hypothetical protein
MKLGNDLPAVTRLIYWIPLLIYPVLTMLVGFNINVSSCRMHYLRVLTRFSFALAML